MKKYPCPSCGAEIPFRTSITAHAVCPYCRTMVVRDDERLDKIGEMAQLPDDMSPFQIGSEGVFHGVRFGIVGRMKIRWDGGAWNEWFIVSDDARKGWLAEAQGFYAPCFEVADLHSRTRDNIADIFSQTKREPEGDWQGKRSQLGLRIQIDNVQYKVVDIKESECVGSEGELPFSAPKGLRRRSIDFVGSGGRFACAEETDKGGIEVFTGAYVEWNDLRCRYFREFEGW